jgi:hypothetical protein
MSAKTSLLVSKSALSPIEEDYEKTVVYTNRVEAGEDLVNLLSKLESNSFEEVRVLWEIPSDNTQYEIYRILKPKGKLLIDKCIKDRSAGQELSSELEIAGFMDLMAAKDPVTNDRFVVCEKPKWESGDVGVLNLAPAATTGTSTWKMERIDLAEDDFVDENDLLSDDIKVNTQDCGVGNDTSGKRRACKNCSCGLADMEQQGEVNQQSNTAKSACGNCYKGDAFRCGSCPFLGKPAFEQNTNSVKLSLVADDI